ncbi:WRKY transcription factor 44 [Linum perenne]
MYEEGWCGEQGSGGKIISQLPLLQFAFKLVLKRLIHSNWNLAKEKPFSKGSFSCKFLWLVSAMETKETDRVVIAKPVPSRPTCSNFGSFTHPQPSQDEAPSTVVYKPQAKLVSKRTASLLANMGNFDSIRNPTRNAASSNDVEAAVHQGTERLTISVEEEGEEDPKAASSAQGVGVGHVFDRPSYDGYNWRKYGQKHVKGSEFPRSYYKCTHPSCPVKKKVERSFDGQIAEIVYKGDHNHSKPLPPPPQPKRNPSNEQGEIRIGTGLPAIDHHAPEFEEGSSRGGDLDEPRSKKRKVEDQVNDHQSGIAAAQEPGTDPEVVGDGFRWRKYGQKVVRGNPFPRSYYRCTNLKCTVRKYVERAPDDPKTLVTTYEGKHNHDMPSRTLIPAPPASSDEPENSSVSRAKP